MEVRLVTALSLLLVSSAHADSKWYGPPVPPGMRAPAWDRVSYPDDEPVTKEDPVDPAAVPSAAELATGKGSRLLPDERRRLIVEKEQLVVAKRSEAIKLLEELLASKPGREATGEALFKLAELYWEDSRLRYVLAMQRYDRETDACKKTPCPRPPRPPMLDTTRSSRLYERLAADYPDYKRIDIVIYLLGFSAREEGRTEDALVWFERLIREKPESPLTPDAWMMIGEHHFETDFAKAREAYLKVLEHKDSPVYDLALFKTAWCEWKLGDVKSAAERFKEVLDLATVAEKSGSATAKKRSTQLRDEALQYLTLLFTEDESITAKDAYEFLASIGGERYSRDVLVRLADLFAGQGRYDRATEAWEFLTQLDPLHPDAPRFQLKIVEAAVTIDDLGRAIATAKKLADGYGPKSDWARANKNRKEALASIERGVEEMLANLAQRIHAEAQADEKRSRRADLPRYTRAAEVYALYLGRFPQSKRAIDVRFLRAEILYFKLNQFEQAGDEYLAVGKTPPGTSPRHKEALLKAMAAFEKLRPKNVSGRRELTAADRKFAAAVGLYARNFPADKDVVGVIFRNGQMFFDYGEWDEAVKQFGIIVSKYPDDENAGAAGDRILEALAKGQDHETIEEWAKTLKKARSFQTPAEQRRLDEIIVQAIGKQAEDLIKKGEIDKAAATYMRAATEYPNDRRAPQSYWKAAAVLETAQQPTKAAEVYLKLAEKYPRSSEAPQAAFAAGKTFENLAYFDRASVAYQMVAYRYQGDGKAPDALFNIGIIEQANGKPKEAIRANLEYAKRYPRRDDVKDVYFRIGIVYADAGEHEKAAQAFKDFVRKYDDSPRVVEAHTRAARSYVAIKAERRASEELAKALRRYKSLSKKGQEEQARWAAEARYLQGEAAFLEYQAIGLDVKPERLEKVLSQKKELLRKAESIYIDVVSYGDPTWAAAGLARIGQAYEQFADQLRATPAPKGLSEAEQQVYKEQLDIFIVDIEDKSISIYESGYKKALELKVYGKYTRQLREGLGRLSATKYPPERESRTRSHAGGEAPEIPLVKDVTREGN